LIGIAALALIAWINYYFSQQISRDERLSALLVACRSFEHSQWNSSCFNQLGLLFENIEPEKTISDEIKIYVMTAINNFYQFIYPEIKKIDELAIQVFNSEAGTEKLKNNVLKLSHLLDTAKIDVEIKGKINAIIQKKVPDLITHVQQILKLISTRVDQHFSTPLHEIINASIQNFRQPDIRIILEPPEMDTEVRIRLLRSDVKFIIENLFQNACRALQDQNDKQIKIQIQINQREVIMLFSDNGEGIPTEIKTHLFGDGISSRAGGKGGFGLFRTKTILYQYGGDIQIKESILSQGTTFELRFRRVQN
jgi:signal transduction histidine kinase